MYIDPWILAFSAVTVIVTIWMGFRSARTSKTASDFFVAGRSVSVGWNASAISGEYLSAASFMGVAGMVMSSGYDALWYPVCYACGYLFLLLFIAGPLRRFGAYTIPDFAEGRFDSPVFRKIAVVFVLFIGFFYTMPQMKGAGTTLAYIFQDVDLRGGWLEFLAPNGSAGEALKGFPYWAGVLIVGAVITLNVALGGMKGITLVQAFQYWAKMFAISVPIFVLMAVYGHYGKQVSLNHRSPQGSSFIQSSNSPAATAFHRNPNESILISLAAQEVAPKTLTIPKGLTIRVGAGFEVAGTVECEGKTHPFKIGTNASTVFDGMRRVAPAFRDLVDGFGWIAPEKRGTAVPVQFSAEHLFDRVEFPARRGLGDSLHNLGMAMGISRPRASLSPGPTVQMRTLLDACLQNRSQNDRVILYFAAELYEKTPPAPTNRVLTLESLTDYFATNEVAVVWAAEDVVKVFPAAGGNVFMPVPVPEAPSSVARAPLPDKAPRDETWLNPFGPLTTKAAKAAKPRSIRFDGELIVTNASLLNGRLMSFPEPEFLARNRGPRKDEALTPATYPASDFLRLYAEVVLLSETDGRAEFSVRHAKSLDTSNVVWNNGVRQPRPQLVRAMEATLAGTGITVVRESGNVFKAFHTKDAVITPVDPRPYSLLYTYSLIIAIVCGTAGLPHILVRFYTNPDGVAAKRTTMWVMILIGVFYVFPPVFGVMGRNLLPELYSGVGAKGTDKVVLELPRILNESKVGKWESGKVGDGTNAASLSPAHSPTFPPAASLQPKRTRIPWGSILSGITCAGAFAAFMSTFSGLLVSMTGAMAHDVYGRMINPGATSEQRLRAFKIAAVIIGGVAILLGSFVEPLEINFMVGQAFTIAAASYFPLLFMAVWWRKLTMRGAATGMLAGGLSALIGISLTSFSTLAVAPGKTGELFALFKPLNDFWAAHPLLRILCEQPAIWAVPLAIILMVIVSKLTSKDVPSDIRMKMLVLHAPEKLGLKQEYIQEHQPGH